MSKDGIEVLVIGYTGAGKTVLIQKLSDYGSKIAKKTRSPPDSFFDFEFPPQPTTGSEFFKAQFSKTKIRFREIGGALRSIWATGLKNTNKVMFLIDSSSPQDVADAQCELLELLGHPDSQSLPFLIVLTKIDIESSLLLEEINNVLRLDMLEPEMKNRIRMTETSTKTHENFDSIIDWLCLPLA
ncbi:putative ADP-ribosylation factor family protein [Blattamonas nauphoetae]|uniref:ADP-ribosylation factor family protein n=1 Tax=Blattamonas nauphoetae TaxID=2049346 RepID=A0ABQ9XNI9_9EUKA|nr:putative ADP-ribosylation factor family protein [Blattamonas nauphoetae]